MQFLKEEGGLKMGDCHLEEWLYESSAGPGKVLREREGAALKSSLLGYL